MTKTIVTNKLDVDINYNSLFNKFDIYIKKNILKQNKDGKFSSDLKNFLTKIKPLNYIPNDKDIIFVMKKESKFDLDNDTKLISKIFFKDLSLDKQVNLIVFSVLVDKFTKYLPITQVSYGKSSLFYLVEAKKSKLNTISFNVALEDDELYLTMKSVTFKEANNKDKKTKVTTDGKILRYATNEDKKVYIQGSFFNQKNNINFFVRDSKDFFDKKHKIKYLYQFYNDIKDNEIIKLKFKTQKVNVKEITENYKNKKTTEEISFLISSIDKINIVNKTNIDYKDFFDIDGLEFEFSDKISNKMPNLVILHPKEYYENNNQTDPYEELKKEDKYSQVILSDTIIKALNSKKPATKKSFLMVVIKELALKQDIKNKKINSINKEIKFHKITKILKDKKATLTIFKDKTIKFDISNNDINLKNGEIILEDFDGNINYIKSTLLTPLVDIKYLDKVLHKKGSFFAKSSELYKVGQSLIGFKYFINDGLFYCNGLSNSPNSIIAKNFVFRKLYPKEELFFTHKLLKKEFLDSIDVFLIKLKDYTAYPYYLKYLNLYLEIEEFDIIL